jgi:hypothetical protein
MSDAEYPSGDFEYESPLDYRLERLDGIGRRLGYQRDALEKSYYNYRFEIDRLSKSVSQEANALRRLRTTATISCYIYADTTDAFVAMRLLQAMQRFMQYLGYEPSELRMVQEGSIASAVKGWFARAENRKLTEDVVEQLRKYGEMKTLDTTQANIDSVNAATIKTLIECLPADKDATVRVGAIFIKQVDGQIGVRTLTVREMIALDEQPQLLNSPRTVEQRLAELTQEAPHPEAEAPGPDFV